MNKPFTSIRPLLALLFLLSIQVAIAQTSNTASQVDLLFKESYELMNNHRFFEAKTLLEKACALDPQSASVHYNLAACYEKLGNTAKAISEYLNALERNPHMPQAMLNLAACYQNEENNTLALSYYQKFLQETPNAKDRPFVQALIARLTKEKLPKTPISSQGASSDQDYFEIVTKGTSQARWQTHPIKVYIFQTLANQKQSSGNYEIIVAAFKEWSDATKLSFSFVQDKSKADITFHLTDSPLKDAANLGKGRPEEFKRGLTDITIKGRTITHGTITISSKSLSNQSLVAEDELKKSCLHEIGHVLGLSGHSPNNHDVLFAIPDSPTVWPVLSKRDKATINRLYAD